MSEDAKLIVASLDNLATGLTAPKEPDVLKFYELLLRDLQKFDGVLWQFPLALVSGNFLVVIQYFRDASLKSPIILLGLSLIDLLFMYNLLKHLETRKKIVDATIKTEKYLRDAKNCLSDLVPIFPEENGSKGCKTLVLGLFWINCAFLVYTAAICLNQIFVQCR